MQYTLVSRTIRLVGLSITSVLAVVMGTIASIGAWGQTVLLDSTGSAAVMTRIMDSSEVVKALGDHLGDLLVELYDENLAFASRVPEWLREEAEKLDTTIIEEVRRQSSEVASSVSVRGAVVEEILQSHRAFVNVVTEKPIDQEARVDLNLVPVVSELFRKLQDSGAWPDSPQVPEVERSASPSDQQASLEGALGFALSDGLSSVRVLGGPEDQAVVDDIRSWVSIATTTTWISAALFLAMTVTAVFTRRTHRARLRVLVGIAAVTGSLVWMIAILIPQRVAMQIDDLTWSPAVKDIVSTMISPLSGVAKVAVGSAVVFAAITEAFFGYNSLLARRPERGNG